MNNLDELVSEAISDFTKVAGLARAEFSTDSITVEIVRKPHKAPRTLPAGQMAVYAFFLNGRVLKLGRSASRAPLDTRTSTITPQAQGARSHARF
jgi:hypothetical protein